MRIILKIALIVILPFGFIAQGVRDIKWSDTTNADFFNTDSLNGEYKITELYKLIDTVEDNQSVTYIIHYKIDNEWNIRRFLNQKKSNGNENSKLDGKQLVINSKGQITNEIIYHFGKKESHRLSFDYYNDNSLKKTSTIKGKKMDGPFVEYYLDGSIKWSGTCKSGKLWNLKVYNDEKGNSIEYGDFKDGNGTVNYFIGGELCAIRVYKNGKEMTKLNKD